MLNYINNVKEKTKISFKNSILEVGSLSGDDAAILANHSNIPSERVIIIEPHPISYSNICKSFPKFSTFNLAFSNSKGIKKFFALKNHPGVSSLLDRVDDFYTKEAKDIIPVECTTGESFLVENNFEDTIFDLCKIDVEGLTYEVLEGFGDKIFNILSMHIECEHHQVWLDQKVTREVSEYLSSKGYVNILEENNTDKQVDQIWVLKSYLK